MGARHPRPERGLISRPGVHEVAEYRDHVDRAMGALLDGGGGSGDRQEVLDLVELGLHHEQQHQELLLMDIKHVLSCNPLRPSYAGGAPSPGGTDAPKAGWIEHPGGPVEIGHRGTGFAFDNESPRHTAQLIPFALADRLVTCGEWLDFIDDGGYTRPELWLSDGWALSRQLGWQAPLYWSPPGGPGGEDTWQVFTLAGERPVAPSEPVCHVSYYEADAFARWAGGRLPTEAEWEAAAAAAAGTPGGAPADGGPAGAPALHPGPAEPGDHQLYGTAWQWTASSYAPYPGFRAAPGAVGEYNGKFMVNQYVLRGGCCVTPPGHIRATYRNFFPASAQWAFSGVRLARDL